MSLWSIYPESAPAESGYYFTEYYSTDYDGIFLKAIWFDAAKKQWCPWRPRVTDEPMVLRFVEPSRNSYYVPCMTWAEERWADLKPVTE